MERLKKHNEYCCVPGCKAEKNEKLHFHRPPSDQRLFKKWWMAVKVEKLTRTMRICSKHFLSENYFHNTGSKKHILKKDTVPTQNLPVTLLTSIKKNPVLVTNRKSRLEKRNNQKLKLFVVENETQPLWRDDSVLLNDTISIHSTCDSLIESTSNELRNPVMQEFEVADQQMVDKSIQVNIANSDKCIEVKTKGCECDNLKATGTKDTFLSFLRTDSQLYTFTGIKSYKLLKTLESCIVKLRKERRKKSVAISVQNSIVLTFIKLKQNLPYSALGVMFDVSSKLCKKYFVKTLFELKAVLGPLIRWPSRSEIQDNMPSCFKKYKDTRVVLDCLEISAKKSKCLKCRIPMYSNYKSNHTVKIMLGVTPSGLISYVSPAYGGRTSDKQIFLKSRLIERTKRGVDAIMVDRGFLIDRECAEYGIKLIRPPFLRKELQLSAQEAKQNANIAAARVHVERRIQRIRLFSILRGPLGTELVPYINTIMHVVCALTNLNPPILGKSKFITD